MTTNPLSILKEGVKAVPAVRYALGVAGVAAAVALVAGFKIDYRVAVFGTLIMFGLMFVLVLFSWFSKHAGKDARLLALALAWAFVLLTIGASSFLFTSFFFEWPRPLQAYVSRESPVTTAPASERRNDGADVPTPSPTVNPTTTKPEETPTDLRSVTPTARSDRLRTEVSRHLDQARSLYAQRKYQSAINECDEVLRIDPRNAEAINLKKQIVNTVKVLAQ